jgi:tetratricopeptide (TPR) repeat protein
MMMPRRVVVRSEDGQQVSMSGGMVHWEFGRMLLDAVDKPSRDDFVRSWYQATLTFKLWTEELDTPHFDHAQRVLPDDPVIRLLIGGLHEALADARVQSAAQSARLPRNTKLSVRSERDELREAERMFRGALEIDPTDVEARVRRGRTLARLDRHKEAAPELRQALASTEDPLLRYYAELFLAAAEEALGRFPDARAAYGRAAVLRPLAQAPKMGLSQLAHRLGDRAAARTALDTILRRPPSDDPTHDPWWSYRFAAGRYTDERMKATYRMLSSSSPR